MDENSDFTWEDASFSPIPRAYYHYKEKHIYKEKRAKNKNELRPKTAEMGGSSEGHHSACGHAVKQRASLV
jgi:hypothetical protein